MWKTAHKNFGRVPWSSTENSKFQYQKFSKLKKVFTNFYMDPN